MLTAAFVVLCFTMCSPHTMLSVSECPKNCKSCYLDGTTKCLLSGCKHGYTLKSDGTCVGESVSPHHADVPVYQCVVSRVQ